MPESFIASRSSSSSTRRPAVSIAASKRRIASTAAAAASPSPRCPLRARRRPRPLQSAAASDSRPRRRRKPSALFDLPVDPAPAGLQQHTAARPEDVLQAPSSRAACSRTPRRDGRRPGTAARPCRRRAGRRRRACRSAGLEFVGMIAWWSVTFASLTTRPSGSTSSPVTYFAAAAYSRCTPTSARDRLDLADHVRRQEARARARIREQLVLLVEPLRRRQRPPRREPEARVGLALQRRQVVQQRRLLAALGLLELRDRRRARRGRRPRSPSPPRRWPAAAATPRGSGPRTCARRPAAKTRVDQPVRLRHERPDLLLAARDDRQRRRLHAPQGHGAVERAAQPDRRRPRRVHAHDPVRLRARPRGLLEQLELRRRPQRAERGLDRRRSSSTTATAAAPASWRPPSRRSRRRSARPRARRRRH